MRIIYCFTYQVSSRYLQVSHVLVGLQLSQRLDIWFFCFNSHKTWLKHLNVCNSKSLGLSSSSENSNFFFEGGEGGEGGEKISTFKLNLKIY